MELAESSPYDYRVSELAEIKHHLPDAGAGVGGGGDCMSIAFPGQAMSRVLILVSVTHAMCSLACVTGVTGKAGGLFRMRLWRPVGKGMLIMASLSA